MLINPSKFQITEKYGEFNSSSIFPYILTDTLQLIIDGRLPQAVKNQGFNTRRDLPELVHRAHIISRKVHV